MRIKTENVKESLEPVDIYKAGSEASEEGSHGLSLVKMMNQQKMIKLVRLRSVVGGYLV